MNVFVTVSVFSAIPIVADGQHKPEERRGELLVCVHRAPASGNWLLLEENLQTHAQVSASFHRVNSCSKGQANFAF